MIAKTTNTNGDIIIDEFPELPNGVSTSGYVKIEKELSSNNESLSKLYDECTANETGAIGTNGPYPVKNFKLKFEDIDEVTNAVTSTIDKNSQIVRPHNRAERRALAKKLGKKGREQFGTISETARKLNYIDLIQKLRDMNKENENEDTTQDS